MPAAATKDKPANESLLGVLKHSLRVTILDALNEESMSPVQFVNMGHVPKGMYKTYQQALSLASYHFRELEKEGCLKIIDTIPRRGAVEHIYEGTNRIFFSDDEYEQMPFQSRAKLSATSFRGVTARTDRAIRLGTFDARTDRHFTWRACHLDEQGWDEMMALLGDTYVKAEKLREEAAERLGDQPQRSPKRIPFTFAMLGYESPPMKPAKLFPTNP